MKWLEAYELNTGAGNIRLKRDLTRMRRGEQGQEVEKFLNKIKTKFAEEIPEKHEMIRRFAVMTGIIFASVFALYLTAKTTQQQTKNDVQTASTS